MPPAGAIERRTPVPAAAPIDTAVTPQPSAIAAETPQVERPDDPGEPAATHELLSALPPLNSLSTSAAIALPAPATLPAPPPTRLALEESAVLEALREYTNAYSSMDVTAAAAVWPSVDRRALARAFATLKSQEVELDVCDVRIAETNATARCRGTVEYVRRIGSPTPRTGQQEWVFTMRKLGTEWKIDGIEASQTSIDSLR